MRSILSSLPRHLFYAEWAVDKGINVLCDKPLIVVPDASWKPKKAALIEKRFRTLFDNSIEYLKGGAHGYIDGVGSLSHSSCHYLDVIAWYLQAAPGTLARVGVSLPYVSRVKDYLAKQGYEQLMYLNNEDPSIVEAGVGLPESVLNAELDFTIHLHLYDKADRKIGLISYTSNHTTFTPRTTKYDPDMLDHTNDKGGGRMSQIYFDIHQGSVQNWLLTKNDVVFEGNDVDITQRLHPSLGQNYSKMSYTDAYDSQTVTPKDLFASFVKKTIGLPVPEKHDEHLQLLNSQELTHRIFSATYELIAQQYVDPSSNQEISISMGEPHEVSETQTTAQE